MDEIYLQLLKHLRGNNKITSVRGWELLLLAACAARWALRKPGSIFILWTARHLWEET